MLLAKIQFLIECIFDMNVRFCVRKNEKKTPELTFACRFLMVHQLVTEVIEEF